MARLNPSERKLLHRKLDKFINDPNIAHEDALGAIDKLDPFADEEEEAQEEEEAIFPPTLPEYPTDIPGPLGELVAARGSLPAAYVGGAGLAAIAAMVWRAEVVFGGGQRQRPSLWIPIVGDTGSGKSPALQLAFEYMYGIQRELYEWYRLQMQGFKQHQIDVKPEFAPLIMDDVTEEKLIRILDISDGHLSIVADELKIPLRVMGGAYTADGKGGSGRLLKLWSGAPVSYSRVGSDTQIYVPRPTVVMTGCLTPIELQLLGPVGDGFRPRWLPHFGASEGVELQDAKAPLSWYEMMARLRTQHGVAETVWKLSDKADRMWRRKRDEWQANSQGSETPITRAALKKADTHALRIAVALAESYYERQPVSLEIPTQVMRAAIQIVDYTLDCWRAAPNDEFYSFSHAQRTRIEAAKQVAEWLESHRDKRATRRDIQRGIRSISNVEDREAILLEYQKMYGEDTCYIEMRKGHRTAMVKAPSLRWRA